MKKYKPITNKDRAECGRQIIFSACEQKLIDAGTRVDMSIDTIANLLHYNYQNKFGCSIDDILRIAHDHFKTEISEGE